MYFTYIISLHCDSVMYFTTECKQYTTNMQRNDI